MRRREGPMSFHFTCEYHTRQKSNSLPLPVGRHFAEHNAPCASRNAQAGWKWHDGLQRPTPTRYRRASSDSMSKRFNRR
jgi:hypothetical protein